MMQHSNYSRRQLLKRLALAGVTIYPGFTGCGGRRVQNKELILFGTGTLNIDDWSQLNRDLGINLKFVDNNNDTGPVITKMIAQKAAEDYDLGGLQGGAERELAEAGKILPWDLDKIKNWPKVWDWARAIPYTKWEGRQYGLPIVINADSMIYLPKRVGQIDSYAAVFDRKLKGRTAMEDAWINSVIFTAIFRKESGLQKIVEPGDLTSDELGEVMEFLIKLKRDGQFKTFWSGWESGVSLMRDESVWVMTGWEPIVYELRRQGIQAEYAIPKEGYEGWSNDLILHIGAKTRDVVDLAHEFADWELSGYYGCTLAKKRGYLVPDDSAVAYASDHLSPQDQDEQKRITEHVRTKFQQQKGAVYWQNVRPRQYKLYEDWWSKLRNA
jgi:putative spermidine/putrescine transport system substrate-binding protein